MLGVVEKLIEEVIEMLGVKVLVTAGVTLPVVDGVKEIVLLTEILNDVLGVKVDVAVGLGV